jgi:diaminopimelate epimerase
MSTLANHAFIKMNGLGNEIVVVDMRGQAGAITAAEARAAAQPDGALYDQLMTLHTARTPGTDGYVRIYNNDGSEAGACGNGMRCIAELLFEETGKRALTFETKAGLLACWKDAEPQVSTVDMGAPRFAWHEIPLAEATDDTRALDLQIGPVDQPILRAPSAVSMGNPHAIFWVDDVHGYDLAKLGPQLEHQPIFPERANISLAQVVSRLQRTGRAVTVTLPGGDLRIEWRERDDHVLMTGPVAYEYEGRFDSALFAREGTPRRQAKQRP